MRDRQLPHAARRHLSQSGGNSESGGDGLVSELSAALERDHQGVARLLDRLAVGDAADDAPMLWGELYAELSAQADAAEEMVYGPMLGNSALGARAERALEAYAVIRDLLEELDDLGPSAPQFPARLARLAHGVEVHVRDEEELFLPHAERTVPLAMLDLFAARFLERKRSRLETLSMAREAK